MGSDPARVLEELDRALEHRFEGGAVPPLWDGNAALRILEMLHARLAG